MYNGLGSHPTYNTINALTRVTKRPACDFTNWAKVIVRHTSRYPDPCHQKTSNQLTNWAKQTLAAHSKCEHKVINSGELKSRLRTTCEYAGHAPLTTNLTLSPRHSELANYSLSTGNLYIHTCADLDEWPPSTKRQREGCQDCDKAEVNSAGVGPVLIPDGFALVPVLACSEFCSVHVV